MKILAKLLTVVTLVGVSLSNAVAQNTSIVFDGAMSYNIRYLVSSRGASVTHSEVKIANLTNYDTEQSSEKLTAGLTLSKKCYNPTGRNQKAYYIAKKKIGVIAPYTYIPKVAFTGGRFNVVPGTYKVGILIYSKSGVWASHCFSRALRIAR